MTAPAEGSIEGGGAPGGEPAENGGRGQPAGEDRGRGKGAEEGESPEAAQGRRGEGGRDWRMLLATSWYAI